jgi:hypothetical protein
VGFLMFSPAEKGKRAQDALSYNTLTTMLTSHHKRYDLTGGVVDSCTADWSASSAARFVPQEGRWMNDGAVGVRASRVTGCLPIGPFPAGQRRTLATVATLTTRYSKQRVVDGMEEVRFESPEPHLLRRVSDIGRSTHRTLMLEVVGIDSQRGGSHCSIPHLKPDKQLLINSQAVCRPSLVENSRVTMSSVEQ